LPSRGCGLVCGKRHGCRGAITAEWALTLPATGLALAIVLGGISLAIDHGRLTHAAAHGQRVLSYGGTPTEVTDYVHRVLASPDATVTMSQGEGEYVGCVTITRPESLWVGRLLAVTREATSCGLVVPR
jgi:hypothetical protein